MGKSSRRGRALAYPKQRLVENGRYIAEVGVISHRAGVRGETWHIPFRILSGGRFRGCMVYGILGDPTNGPAAWIPTFEHWIPAILRYRPTDVLSTPSTSLLHKLCAVEVRQWERDGRLFASVVGVGCLSNAMKSIYEKEQRKVRWRQRQEWMSQFSA